MGDNERLCAMEPHSRLRRFNCTYTAAVYHISSVIRLFFSFQHNPKNLDPCYKTDLDLWDCLGRVKVTYCGKISWIHLVICSHSRERKTLSYSQIITVCSYIKI